MNSPSITPGKAVPSNGVSIFIQRLVALLEAGPHDIVGWADDGQSFVIYQPTPFAANVLPVYYGHRKFPTFLRMLNFYGFHRCRSKHVEFSHLTFQRGNDAGQMMIRRRFKQELDNDDREIVEDIEETILGITRHLERERRLDDMVLREYLDVLLRTPQPSEQALLPSPPISSSYHSPCSTPRPTVATTCATPAFKMSTAVGQLPPAIFEFPSS
ncbi:hypothetical protein DYB25_003121 [Aphanomyces astaci]|uniref:HSF-type DNA-binding domain-containing protein n=1 Tax=Aphanomyces astaci TaxID=112090 RepID=A0A397FI74_APHAT|nr:hypothetical protein DYB25_003121 [Aphanomyces astaci]RHY53668.1 hypothetical protein DYB30_006488 [Aphanomyces astaci]RHZ25336.1 hypothetical protein DYB31_009309 [Aphanomyces astaci]RHZ29250.1 hypothetical protein DYB26_005200 [Aphanomyces astaci]